MAVEFANKCKFDNPELHKPHGKRALGITLLQNSSLSEQGKLKAARHSDMKSHVRYQRDTDENLEKKYEALNPSLISKDSSSIISTSTATSSIKPTVSPSTQNVTNQNPNPSFSCFHAGLCCGQRHDSSCPAEKLIQVSCDLRTYLKQLSKTKIFSR